MKKEDGIVAATEPVPRADVDNGTRHTEYRVRRVSDAERNARWETYGNTPWAVERRTIRTKDGVIEHGEHEEWNAFARGEDKRSAIEDAAGDTGFLQSKSMDKVHQSVVDRVNKEKAWRADKAKRLKAAENEVRFSENEVLRIKETANKKYGTALKRAGIYDEAQRGKADAAKIEAIQSKLQATWKPEFEKAKAKLAENIAKQKAIESEKLTDSKPTTPTPELSPDALQGGEVQGSISGGNLPLNYPSPSATPIPAPKPIHVIMTELGKGLGVPVQIGRLAGAGGGATRFGAWFKPIQNLVGIKRANAVTDASHEFGHKLDQLYSIKSDPSIKAELMHLGDNKRPDSFSSWTKSKSTKYRLGEGVAEFMRFWLTNPTESARLAPKTTAHFERILAGNEDIGRLMKTAQTDIQTYQNSESQSRIRSHRVGGNPDKSPYTIHQMMTDVLDELHYLRLFSDDIQRLSDKTIPPSENVYTMSRLLRGSAGVADVFIKNGRVDPITGEVTMGTGLVDALKPVSGKLEDFKDWMIARQAREMHAKGKETGLDQKDIDATFSRFEKDANFNKAWDDVHTWLDSLMNYSVAKGHLTSDGAARMKEMWKEYVPMHRLFEIEAGVRPESAGGTGGPLASVGIAYKHRKGSTRPIVDPIESMIKNAYSIVTVAEKTEIMQKMAEQSNAPGMAKWIYRIATPKEHVKVAADKVKEQLEALGADTSNLDDVTLNFFRDARRAPVGENTIAVRRGDKVEFYRLNGDLYRTVQSLDAESAGKLIRMIAVPSQILRAGATEAPDFIVSNAIKDTWSNAVTSRYGWVPGETLVRGVWAMVNNPKLVAEWKASGGDNAFESIFYDRDKIQQFMRQKIAKELTPREQATIVAKSPLLALRWISSKSEAVNRLGEYQIVLNRLLKDGMDIGEARRQAAFEARDLQDFAKNGAKVKQIKLVTAFWNARLQGQYRFYRAMKEKPLKTIATGMAFMTLPKMMEMAINWDDKDYWDRPAWERYTMFMIPTGKDSNGRTTFIRIPFPHTAGLMFAGLPASIISWARNKDPNGMKEFKKVVLGNESPNPLPQIAMAIIGNFMTGKRGWDFFRGREIVPQSLEYAPAELQFTEQTSLTARKVGGALGMSPMKVDNLIGNLTGTLGRQATAQISDRAIAAMTGEPVPMTTAYPFSRFIATPAGVNSETVTRFYENLNELETLAKRDRLGQIVDYDKGLLKRMRASDSRMSKLRKEARGERNASRKQAIYLEIRDEAERYATP